jgi:regulatory protein spx
MIKIYTSPSCSSCRKVKAWFEKEKIPFQEINILKHELSVNELKEMLNKSLDGTDEIISTRSNVFKEQNVDLNSMSVGQLCNFIKANPSILKRPIIVDDSKIQVGYNQDEIEIFEKAKSIASSCCKPGVCPDYKKCVHRFGDKRPISEVCEDKCNK